MATRLILKPDNAEFMLTPASAMKVNDRPALAFDGVNVETCYWTDVAPQGIVVGYSAIIYYLMASAIAGTVDFEVAVEAVTPGDVQNLGSTTSFGAVNAGQGTIPATNGYMSALTISLANIDDIAAGDYFRLRLERDADDAVGDTAIGDCYVLGMEIRDGA